MSTITDPTVIAGLSAVSAGTASEDDRQALKDQIKNIMTVRFNQFKDAAKQSFLKGKFVGGDDISV